MAVLLFLKTKGIPNDGLLMSENYQQYRLSGKILFLPSSIYFYIIMLGIWQLKKVRLIISLCENISINEVMK